MKKILLSFLSFLFVLGIGLGLSQFGILKKAESVKAEESEFVMVEGASFRSYWSTPNCGITFGATITVPNDYVNNVRLFIAPYDHVEEVAKQGAIDDYITAFNAYYNLEGENQPNTSKENGYYTIVEPAQIPYTGGVSFLGGLKNIQEGNESRRFFGIYYYYDSSTGKNEYAKMPNGEVGQARSIAFLASGHYNKIAQNDQVVTNDEYMTSFWMERAIKTAVSKSDNNIDISSITYTEGENVNTQVLGGELSGTYFDDYLTISGTRIQVGEDVINVGQRLNFAVDYTNFSEYINQNDKKGHLINVTSTGSKVATSKIGRDTASYSLTINPYNLANATLTSQNVSNSFIDTLKVQGTTVTDTYNSSVKTPNVLLTIPKANNMLSEKTFSNNALSNMGALSFNYDTNGANGNLQDASVDIKPNLTAKVSGSNFTNTAQATTSFTKTKYTIQTKTTQSGVADAYKSKVPSGTSKQYYYNQNYSLPVTAMYGHSAYENDVKNTSGVVTAKVGVTNPTRVLEYRPNTYSVTVNYKTNRTHQEPSLVTSKTTSGLFGYSISVEPQTLTGYTSPSTYTKTINESIIINNQNYVEPTAQVFTIKSYDLTINYVWHGSHESGKINGGSAGTSKTESVEYKSSKSIASYTNITGYSPYLDTNRTNSASTAGVGSMPASDKTITVYYLPNIYTVTLNTVSGGNLYVNRQANSVTAEYKSKVLLENKANADYVWNYYTVGGNNQYQPYFTITGNTTVSGSFTKFFNTPTITVKDTPSSVNLDALPGLITYKKLGNNIDGSGKIYTQHKYSNEYIGDISRYNGFDVSFWDYNSLTWSNANGNHAEVANGYPKSQWGIGTLSTAWFPVVITPQTKVIRLYTGVWQATNTIKVYKNSGTTPIVSTSFSAGGTAAKKVVDINVSTTVTDCVNIQLVTSNAESGGNSTLAAVALLDGSNGYEQALTLDQSSTNYNITLNQKLNGSSNYVSLYYKRYKAGSIESGCVEGKNYVASDFSGDNFWDFDYLVNNARDGMGRGDEIKITLSNVDSRVKVIRVLTGVWRAKNTTSLSGGWVATAPTFESDASVDGSGNAIGNAKANCIDFYVNTTMPATITLTIKKTALDSLVSNVSLVGIAFYGNPFEIVCGTTSQYVVSREDATQSVIDGRTVYNLPQSYYDNTDKSSYASLHNGKITKIGDVDALVDESDVSSLLYWEHYNSDGNGGTYTATSSTSIKDYVTYCNVSRNPSANNFNDYLIPISWDYGTSSEEEYSKGLGSYDYNVMGCVAGQHVNQAGAVCATIQVPAGNTYLRVFTGALNCTCKVFITYNNGVLAERLETAGSKADSVAMNFMIDSDSAATIDLIIMVENPTDPTNNVVLTAIALGQGV